MRKILIFLFLVCFLSSLQARTFVLVVGISNYGQEEANLHQTVKDAKSFYDLMATQTKNIIYITSSKATKENLLEKLQLIADTATEKDQIMFFFSGHGYEGGVLAYGLRPLYYVEMIDILKTSRAQAKIVFIDACHAGSLTKDFKDRMGYAGDMNARPNDCAIFMSCRPNEVSRESAMVGAGFFTQALIKGMRGLADTDKDRSVTLLELFKYIYKDLVARSKEQQHPQLLASPELYDRVLIHWKE